MKKTLTLLIALAIGFMPMTSFAQTARYQIISLSEGVDMGSEKVMIVDTVSGHLWTWMETPSSGAGPGGRMIIYQGQVRPGNKIGDIIDQQEWSRPRR